MGARESVLQGVKDLLALCFVGDVGFQEELDKRYRIVAAHSGVSHDH
ncbi:hypothetical protein [Streptomyces sp900116325]